jgi:hypothetical protein
MSHRAQESSFAPKPVNIGRIGRAIVSKAVR